MWFENRETCRHAYVYGGDLKPHYFILKLKLVAIVMWVIKSCQNYTCKLEGIMNML